MLRRLEAHEINQVLRQNFSVWSPGLDRSRYRHYQWWQMNHNWGRRHLEYFGYFSDSGKLVASCKRYKFQYQAKTKTYNIAGIGAVFVPAEARGNSYGLKMLDDIADLSFEDGFDATLLNSDIDPEYYGRIGYHLFDASGFSASLTEQWLQQAIKHMDSISDKDLDESFNIRAIHIDDLAEMCRHHCRWLAAQAFGMKREPLYWQYKLGRELYLFSHSSLTWPKLEIITDNFGKFNGGYALIEQAGPFMRVLEVVGPERIRNSLWSQILRLAQRRQARTLRGWEIVKPPLKGLTTYQRDWSLPMICPLKDEIESELLNWLEVSPPTMLELDHF